MIHSTAFIAHGAMVVGDVHLGQRASVWYNCVLRGDTDRITVGDHSNIQDLTVMHADAGIPCRVGARVGVGHRAILHGCIVEDDCLIGMGAVLMNNVHVSTGSVVAAGALLPEGMIVPSGRQTGERMHSHWSRPDTANASRMVMGWSRTVKAITAARGLGKKEILTVSPPGHPFFHTSTI